MLAGVAGFLMAAKNGAVNPELLSWHESGGVLMNVFREELPAHYESRFRPFLLGAGLYGTLLLLL